MAYANDLYNKYINDMDKYKFEKNHQEKIYRYKEVYQI